MQCPHADHTVRLLVCVPLRPLLASDVSSLRAQCCATLRRTAMLMAPVTESCSSLGRCFRPWRWGHQAETPQLWMHENRGCGGFYRHDGGNAVFTLLGA